MRCGWGGVWVGDLEDVNKLDEEEAGEREG